MHTLVGEQDRGTHHGRDLVVVVRMDLSAAGFGLGSLSEEGSRRTGEVDLVIAHDTHNRAVGGGRSRWLEDSLDEVVVSVDDSRD